MIHLRSYYGMPYTDAPLMSLTFMRDCGLHITVGTFMVIRLIVRLIAMLITFAVICTVQPFFLRCAEGLCLCFLWSAVIVLVAVMGNVSIW